MALDAELYRHESDRAAMQALQAIPGFTQLLKGYMSIWNERQFRIMNMSSNLRIGEKQLRKYHDMLPPICERLGIEIPELYLQLDVVPNSYTYGDSHPFIVLTSGLFDALPEELIPTVLAHECGHIACRHTLFTTMGNLILSGALRAPGLTSLVTIPLQVAFAYWMRCSEFSADRAAILCDGTADRMIETCMCFAGYGRDVGAQANVDAFLEQAAEYREMVKNSKWNKTLEFMLFNQMTHPLTAVRAYECREWVRGEQYARLTRYMIEGTAPASMPRELPLPDSARHCIGRMHGEVEAMFQNAGFVNVVAIETPNGGLLARPGQVVAISADGKRNFERGEWCPERASINVIYYVPDPAAEANRPAKPVLQVPEAAKNVLDGLFKK